MLLGSSFQNLGALTEKPLSPMHDELGQKERRIKQIRQNLVSLYLINTTSNISENKSSLDFNINGLRC